MDNTAENYIKLETYRDRMPSGFPKTSQLSGKFYTIDTNKTGSDAR